MNLRVYKPFTGGSIHGFGDVTIADKPSFKYMFQNETGTIYFNEYTDNQVKGLKLVTEMKLEEITQIEIDALPKLYTEKDMAEFGQYCIRQYTIFRNSDSNFAKVLLNDFLTK